MSSQEETERHVERTPYEVGDCDRSDVPARQGMSTLPAASRRWERHGASFPQASTRSQLCQQLDFRSLASRTVREYISVVSSHQCGTDDLGLNPRPTTYIC